MLQRNLGAFLNLFVCCADVGLEAVTPDAAWGQLPLSLGLDAGGPCSVGPNPRLPGTKHVLRSLGTQF